MLSFAVVPLAGTWIEINKEGFFEGIAKSFPSRERGLKSLLTGKGGMFCLSFPSRERGLKY